MSPLDHYKSAHFLNLVKELAVCEFKIRDQSTLLGFLWTLLHPTLLFVVLYALFVKWMGNHVPSFPLYLMVGVVQWNYFAKGTTGGLSSILQKSSLISNYIFPREVLVLASVLANLYIHLLEVCVMMPFLVLMGDPLSWKWLLLPAVIAIETLMVLAVSFFLARLAVDYKDVGRVWEIVTMAGFFVTPIFYPVEIIAPDRRQIILLNPMARLINETRQFMVYDTHPSFAVLGLLLAGSLVFLCLGHTFFKKGEPHFAEKFP